MNGKKVAVIRKRMLAWFLVMVMALTTVWPSVPARAEGDGEKAEVSAEAEAVTEDVEPAANAQVYGAYAAEECLQITADEMAELSVIVEADEGAEVCYHWYQKADPEAILIEGETGSTIEVDGRGRYYYCRVTQLVNGTETKICDVDFEVEVDNQLTVAPEKMMVGCSVGEEVVLRVIVSATDTYGLTYVWKKGSGPDSVVLEGENSDSITVKGDDFETYMCYVTDAYLNTAFTSVFYSPQLHLKAEAVEDSVAIAPGGSATLEVTAEADDMTRVTYKWYKGYTSSGDVLGTESTLTVSPESRETYCCCVQGTAFERIYVTFNVYVSNEFSVEVIGEQVRAVPIGETVELGVSVSAIDKSRIAIQWYDSDGTKLEGETGSTYSFVLSEPTKYTCKVTDGFSNTEWSADFYVNIENHLSATPKAEKVTVDYGSTGLLEVEASADDETNLTYTWYECGGSDFPGTLIADETGSSLEVEAGAFWQKSYCCRVKDQYGTFVDTYFVLQVDNHLTLVSTSQTIRIKPGEKKTIQAEVTALDKTRITYTWSECYGVGPLTQVQEGNSASFEIDADGVIERKVDGYQCWVRDIYGGSRYFYVTVRIDNNFSATRVSQLSQAIAPNEKARLEVSVSGYNLDNVTYRWTKLVNGKYTDIEGAPNAAVYEASEAGNYTVYIEDGFGGKAQYVFGVTLDNQLRVTASQSKYRVAFGEEVTLTATVSAKVTDKVTYEWYKYEVNGTPTRLDENTDTLTVTADSSRCTYGCTVLDGYGSTYSVSFSFNIENHFKASAENGFVEIQAGQMGKIRVLVSGDNLDYVSYVWRHNDSYSSSTITGVTTDTLDCIPGSYTCTVSDGFGNSVTIPFTVYANNHFKAWAAQSEQLVEYAQPVTLTVCVSADDMSGIYYKWERGYLSFNYDGPYMYYPGNNYEYGITGNTVEIGNVTGYNGYRCTVSDGYGNSQVVEFTYGVENHFVAKAAKKEVLISKGDDAQFDVVVSGDDLTGVTYSWYLIQGEFHSRRQVSESGARYTLPAVAETMEMQCVIRDRFSNARCVNFVAVIDNHLEATEVSKEVYVGYGETAVLEASVSADDVSQIYYTWASYQTGAVVAQGMGVSRCNIENVTMASRYYCYVKDQYGNSQRLMFDVGVENHWSLEAVDQTVYYVPAGGKVTIRAKVTGDDLENIYINCSRYMNGRYYSGVNATMDENGIISFEVSNVTESQVYSIVALDKYQTAHQLMFYIYLDNAFVAEPVVGESDFMDADGNCVVRGNKGEDVTLKLNLSMNNEELLRITWKEYEYYGMDNLVFVRNVENVGDELVITNVQTDMLAEAYVTDYYGNSARIRFLVKLMGDPGTIWSASASFSGSMALNFYCEIPEYVLTDAGAYVTLTKGTNQPEKFMLSKAKNMAVSGHSTKRFAMAVNAKEIRDKIVLRLYDGEGYEVPLVSGSGVNYELNGCAMSILEYCDMVIQKSTDSKMIALAKAVKDYGTAAQLYFGYQSTGLSVSNRVKNLDKQVLIDGFAAEKTGTFPSGVVGASISLELLSDNTLRVYFEYAEGVGAGRFAYYVDGKKKTIIRTTAGKCYLEITGIAAKELDTVHTFTVTNGKKTMEFKVSALTYARSLCMSGTKNKPINLGKALYLYNQAAKAYFKK